MKKYIAILVNDVKLFEYMLNNIPDSIVEQTRFILFNETRIGDKTKQIKKLADIKGIKYRLFTTDDVNSQVKKFVDTPFCDAYSMSLNILMVWFCFKFNQNINKLLVLDDDVLIVGDLDKVFTSKSKFKSDPLAALSMRTGLKSGSQNAIRLKQEFDDIFEIQTDIEILGKTYCNGGTKYYIREQFDIDLFEKYLTAFFQNEYIASVWENRRTFRTAFLDERFEQCLNIVFDMHNFELDDFTELLNAKPDKINYKLIAKKAKPLIHVCNHKWKDITLEQLKDWRIIKW